MMGRTCIVLASVICLSTAAGAQEVTVDQLRQAAADYLKEYAPRVSGTQLEENYTLIDSSGGRMGVPNRIGSDVLLLNNAGRVFSLRDAFSVGGAKIREREPRMVALLTEPTMEGFTRAQEFARQSFQHFLMELIMRTNDPALVLQFLLPENADKVSFKIDGRKKMDGVQVIGLSFAENRSEGAKYLIGTRGNASAAGRFWVDPATGRIHQTELELESKTESARAVVTYGYSKDLDVWVPTKAIETYQMRQPDGGPAGVGSSQRFEATVAYSKPRHTPIDLGKIR